MYLCRRLLISLNESFRFTIEYCFFFYYSNWEAYLCPLIFSNKSIVMWMYMCVCKCMNVYVCMCVYMYVYVNVQEDMFGSVCNVCISCQYNINCTNNVYVAHYVLPLSLMCLYFLVLSCLFSVLCVCFSIFMSPLRTKGDILFQSDISSASASSSSASFQRSLFGP